MMFWSNKDPFCAGTISAVASLSGVAAGSGMWNDFNDMQQAGWLDGVHSNGDYQARWLTWLLLRNGQLRNRTVAPVGDPQ
jgi:hypothetical protein